MSMPRSLLLGAILTTVVGVAPAVIFARAARNDDAVRATGRGHYLVGGSLDVQFSLRAARNAWGSASGTFHHRTNDGLGIVDFYANVTCLEVDPALGRAWIGGVITRNLSTSPDFIQAIHQPGHDIWFRVLDADESATRDEGADQNDDVSDIPDRSTFVGFEGAIPSSAAYCASRPWLAGNARTWPVTVGKIIVREEDR